MSSSERACCGVITVDMLLSGRESRPKSQHVLSVRRSTGLDQLIGFMNQPPPYVSRMNDDQLTVSVTLARQVGVTQDRWFLGCVLGVGVDHDH